jgi:hypothetical protein
VSEGAKEMKLMNESQKVIASDLMIGNSRMAARILLVKELPESGFVPFWLIAVERDSIVRMNLN